jgi:hypothetical protein
MWSVSPFLIQQLETEGVRALEVFWNDFDIEDYWSETLKLNAEAISNEAIKVREQENIEIQGNWAGLIHSLLTGDDDDSTLTGTKDLDFIVREEVIGENSWCLVNALVGAKEVRDSGDYIASYLSPEETKNISLALAKIENEDFKVRCMTFFCESKQKKIVVTGDEITQQWYTRKYIADISEAEEFIKSELIPLYSKASEQGYGILIGWSI